MFRNAIREARHQAHEVADHASDYAGQVRDYAGQYHLSESPITRTAGKVPTDLFLIAAGGSIVGSLVLKLLGRHRDAEFVGHWAPTLLTLGLLSKLVEHDEHT
ncbi:MAG TPA: hypothetical protein VF624_10615 [Tepidisphaeraceae bacterium]|jgi:hypothetical protein